MVHRLHDVQGAGRVELAKLHGSFSGALVLLMVLYRRDGQELPTTVLKYDLAAEIEDEAAKTSEHGPRWGPAHPRVLDLVAQPAESYGADARPKALMQIDLCGGAFGVPGLVSRGAVATLADVCMSYIAGA